MARPRSRRPRWSVVGGDTYILNTAPEVAKLEPGIYSMMSTQQGFFFVRSGDIRESLLRMPGTPAEEVVSEIEKFWGLQERYEHYGFAHKRGILLYGPPGSGKSCTLKLISKDVIARGGVVFIFKGADLFTHGYNIFRRAQPDTPIVCLMEDLDAILKKNQSTESEVLNLLDGAEPMHKVVFVATTNYPEELRERIKNRPSRFDRRFLVDHPSAEGRRMYLESLLPEGEELESIEQYVKDTQGMSLAHLKELFTGTVVYGNDYAKVLKELQTMAGAISSHDTSNTKTGVYV